MNNALIYAVAAYLAAISLFTSLITVADKLKAKKGSFRVPEKILLLLAVFGGSVAEYFTMRLIRHKTRHRKFMTGLPVIIILQLFAVILIFSSYILH